jgi:hypothetical protein
MGERTAAEVLAEKLGKAWEELPYNVQAQTRIDRMATRLAEDPAITVRTDMVVERFVVEIHRVRHPITLPPTAAQMHRILTDPDSAYRNEPDHRIIVRPYPEGEK